MSALTCAMCGNEEPEGARFCGNCGAELGVAEPAGALTPSSAAQLGCPSCGNVEPPGARFCGDCGSPLPAGDPALVAAAPATLEPQQAEGTSVGAAGPRRRLLLAGGAALLLLAGGAVAAVLTLTGGESSADAASTERHALPPASSDSRRTTAGPALEDTARPGLQAVAAGQAALDARVQSLVAGLQSFAALRGSASALAATVARTEGSLDGIAPGDAADANELQLLHRALAAHLAYATAIANLPQRPRLLTTSEARAAIIRAQEAEVAYQALATTAPGLPRIVVSSSDGARLLAFVPKPASATTRREVNLAPLLVGVRPDDPDGEGRCFGAYSSRASLRVSGVVHHDGFVQCGDDTNGDPRRASGVYRFAGTAYPTGSKLIRLTATAAIDESSARSQVGSRVTWTAFYDGTQLCSATVVWSGSLPTPRTLDCRLPAAAATGSFDIGRLRIQQVATPASTGSFWAGLLDPVAVVEVPG